MEILVIHIDTRRSNAQLWIAIRATSNYDWTTIGNPHPSSPLLFSRVWERRTDTVRIFAHFSAFFLFLIWIDDNLLMLHNFYSSYERKNIYNCRFLLRNFEETKSFIFLWIHADKCVSFEECCAETRISANLSQISRLSAKSISIPYSFLSSTRLFLTVLPWHLIDFPSCLLLHDESGLVTQQQCSWDFFTRISSFFYKTRVLFQN